MRSETWERWWIGAALLLAVSACVVQGLRFERTFDDAYIAFAYARNWVDGHGLVFNPGERVEGYTCFLWVVLSTLGIRLGFSIERWSTACGLASAAVAIFAAWRLARELAPERMRAGAALAAVVAGAYPPLAWWASSGMETALFTALVTLALWRHVRDGEASLAAPICLGLAALARPEGWMVAAVLCLDAVRRGGVGRGGRYTGVFLALFVPYYAWRFWYYGYPLPNTFYAKVGTTAEQLRRGVAYLQTFLGPGRGWWLVAGGAAGAVAGMRRASAVHLLLLMYIAYIVAVGGDAFPGHRFFVPLVPALSALAVAGLLRWSERLSLTPAAAYAAGVVLTAGFLAACLPILGRQQVSWQTEKIGNEVTRRACEAIKVRASAGDAIATVGIGLIKYCTGLRVIDMVGLTDEHIAHRAVPSFGRGIAGHEKFDSAYVLSLRPEFILIPHRSQPGPQRVAAVRDMWSNPEFQRSYVRFAWGYRRK